MKNKIFFIVVSIIGILMLINVIMSANNIIQEEIATVEDVYSIFSANLQNKMIETIKNSGNRIIIIYASLGIIMYLMTIYIATKNTILRNKGTLIVFNILHLFFGLSGINKILAITSILVLLCLKRKNPEDYPIKKEIPKIEKRIYSKKSAIIGISLFIIYFSQFIWSEYIPETKSIRLAISIVFYLAVFLLAIAYWNKEIIEYIKIFGKNIITYIKYIIPRLLGMYVVYFVIALFVIVITGEIGSENQEKLESMNTYIVVPLAIIWAPIVEETIFRGLIHRVIKNKYLFIIMSALCFGLLHTAGQEVTILNTIMKALPYSVLGVFLAYIYDKTENITCSMFIHALINTIASIITLI